MRQAIGAIVLLGPLLACRSLDHSLERDRFTLRSDGELTRVNELAGRVAFLFDACQDLFRVDASALPHLEIIDLVPRGEIRVGEEDPGRYEGRISRITLQETADDELLLHELAHHFVRALCARPKPWINEGLAVYAAWSAVGEDRIVPGELAIHHAFEMKALLREGRALGVRELVALEPSAFYAADAVQRSRLYTQAWALTYYLVRGRLLDRPFAEQVRSVLKMNDADIVRCEREYREYWSEFSPLAELRKKLRSRDPLRRHMATVELGLLGDVRGIASLARVAANVDLDTDGRLAALLAIGAIVAQRSEQDLESERDPLRASLLDLRHDGDLKIAETAARLYGAVSRMDKGVLLQQFALKLASDPVYPSRVYARRAGR